jgi:chemotaxis protein MotB
MKEKPSEWIAISDLMAGVMAVVMLLLVLAVLQKSANEIHYQEELAKSNQNTYAPVTQLTHALAKKLDIKGANELMAVDLRNNKLTLRDGVFERGSACLTKEAQSAIASVQTELSGFLTENPKARILVEGYTDNMPVRTPVTDFQRFCTVYDDNFTLSAARAREARRALLGTALNSNVAKRIVVAGFGDSHPLQDVPPSDSRNRRVEVQFLLEN